MSKDVKLKSITLEWYANYFNNVLYPLHYPYYIKPGIGSNGNKTLYLSIQIHTSNGLLDTFKIWGENDKEIIDAFEKLDFEGTLKCLVKE